MLRRWLAALHSLDAEDEAVAARLHEARSPPSEEATVEAKQIAIPGADARSAPDAEEEKNIPDAPAAPAAEASSSPPGSPSDPDAEWADVQMPAHGRTVAPAIVAAADDRVSIDVVVDAANVASASVLRFRSERAKISSFGDKGDDDDESDVFDFRDVLLRSRCLENLVASFAVEPAADDDEARLFLKLVDALVWDASSEKSSDETSEPGVDSRISSSLVACVARAGAALRDPKRTAEVQLGDDALVAMLSAGAGSVKKIGAAETLLRRERRLRRALEANAGAVRLLSHEASASSSRGALPRVEKRRPFPEQRGRRTRRTLRRRRVRLWRRNTTYAERGRRDLRREKNRRREKRRRRRSRRDPHVDARGGDAPRRRPVASCARPRRRARSASGGGVRARPDGGRAGSLPRVPRDARARVDGRRGSLRAEPRASARGGAVPRDEAPRVRRGGDEEARRRGGGREEARRRGGCARRGGTGSVARVGGG
jgi:hypothetical protein